MSKNGIHKRVMILLNDKALSPRNCD
jgi:hypothetical protein